VPSLDKAATGSGPHAVPTSELEILREWERVLGMLDVFLAGALEPARVLGWTPDRLELGFPSQFESNKDAAEGRLDSLRKVLHEAFGKTPQIAVKLIDAAQDTAARSVLEASREQASAERNRREAEAREHPITKHVLQTFGAQIKEIKTDV
jgi:hypothetical protein